MNKVSTSANFFFGQVNKARGTGLWPVPLYCLILICGIPSLTSKLIWSFRYPRAAAARLMHPQQGILTKNTLSYLCIILSNMY